MALRRAAIQAARKLARACSTAGFSAPSVASIAACAAAACAFAASSPARACATPSRRCCTISGDSAWAASSGRWRLRSASSLSSSSLRAVTWASALLAELVCWRTPRTACASALRACARRTWASVGSSLTSTWPASTRWVSSVVAIPADDTQRVEAGQDRDHRAGHLRRDRHLVAAYVGVVGLLAVREHEQPEQQPDERDQDEHPGHDQQRTAALARVLGGQAAVVVGRLVGFSGAHGWRLRQGKGRRKRW